MAKKKDWVDIEINLDDDSFLTLAKEAHKLDITFNQHVCNILTQKMNAEEKKEPNSRWH
jgi:hypothetical protein